MESISSVLFGMSLKFDVQLKKNVLQNFKLYLHGCYDSKKCLFCFPSFKWHFFFHVRQFLWLGGSPLLPSRPSANETKVLSCQGSDSANAGKHTMNSLLLIRC